MTDTGTIQINGETVHYQLSTQSSFAGRKQVVAECRFAGEPITGEARLTQRAAELSLKRAITKKLDRDREIVEERQRLERWNSGQAKIIGGGWMMGLISWARPMVGSGAV